MHFNHEQEHDDLGMVLIQANLDDMNPEYCPHVAEQLFQAGANDVYWIPIMMKKGRPALMLNVLADHSLVPAMERLIFTETTTLGVRLLPAQVHRLGRKWEEVDTRWGKVRVKTGYYQGQMVQYAPEYEDCKGIADRHRLPLKQVYDEVRSRFREDGREG